MGKETPLQTALPPFLGISFNRSPFNHDATEVFIERTRTAALESFLPTPGRVYQFDLGDYRQTLHAKEVFIERTRTAALESFIPTPGRVSRCDVGDYRQTLNRPIIRMNISLVMKKRLDCPNFQASSSTAIHSCRLPYKPQKCTIINDPTQNPHHIFDSTNDDCTHHPLSILVVSSQPHQTSIHPSHITLSKFRATYPGPNQTLKYQPYQRAFVQS